MTTDTKTEQLERLITKIETRFSGKFITEEQWKFVLDRLTVLEKKAEKKPRKNSLTAQIQQLLYEAPQGLTIEEMATKTGRKQETINSILFHLKKQGIIKSKLFGLNKKSGAIYFYNRGDDHGTNRE